MRRLQILVPISVFLMMLMAGSTTAAGTYEITPDSIHRHISVLAHDSLEGREVGEVGEMKAARYIIGVFESIGLEPRGDDGGWLQAFEFTKSTDFGPNNHLTVNGYELDLGEEFSPMRQSASAEFAFDRVIPVGYGITVDSVDGDYDDYADRDVSGKALLIKRFAPPTDSTSPINFDRYSFLTEKINNAIEHEAGAIIFITPSDQDDSLAAFAPTRVNAKEIPILFLRRKALERMGLNIDDPVVASVGGQTELIKTIDTGYNVVGYLPGASDSSVIIGAHYDHLGWGTSASRYLGEEKMIHNGADDNGSGTAVMMELGRYFSSTQDDLDYSQVYIAFSGEEAGILGSSYFARHMTVDSSKVRMMVNLDMIGRLKDQDGLVVFGTGTATEFKEYFDSLQFDKFKVINKESGIGASDHTAFYNRKIPVLFFFTGAHKDYHKPSDDVELIDFEGTAAVGQFVVDVVSHFDDHPGMFTYQRTKSDGRGHSSARYSVTLGIMPDFITEVEGLRIDGISPDRPADRAGLVEGDVIIKMGDITIGDIYDYMGALGKFRKGDSTEVVIQREADTLVIPVKFE